MPNMTSSQVYLATEEHHVVIHDCTVADPPLAHAAPHEVTTSAAAKPSTGFTAFEDAHTGGEPALSDLYNYGGNDDEDDDVDPKLLAKAFTGWRLAVRWGNHAVAVAEHFLVSYDQRWAHAAAKTAFYIWIAALVPSPSYVEEWPSLACVGQQRTTRILDVTFVAWRFFIGREPLGNYFDTRRAIVLLTEAFTAWRVSGAHVSKVATIKYTGRLLVLSYSAFKACLKPPPPPVPTVVMPSVPTDCRIRPRHVAMLTAWTQRFANVRHTSHDEEWACFQFEHLVHGMFDPDGDNNYLENWAKEMGSIARCRWALLWRLGLHRLTVVCNGASEADICHWMAYMLWITVNTSGLDG